jgi:hypothetical protein
MPLARPSPSQPTPATAFRRPPTRAPTSRTGNPNARRFRHSPPVSFPRVHATRGCMHTSLPVSEGSTIIHDFVASRTIATPSPVRPGQRCRPCVSAGTTEQPLRAARAGHREHPKGAESRPRVLCARFPAIMERWIV